MAKGKKKQKVFCIGFQKTGTTSLGRALEILGYDVCGPIGVTNPNINKKALIWALERVPKYDAFQDNPWPLLYRELDFLYPGSKFILTTRDARSWMRSMYLYFGSYEAAAEVWIYGGIGTPIKNRSKFVKRFKQHNKAVKYHFKDRQHDFLELNFKKGHGWQELCTFLGEDIPNVAFPTSNKSGNIETEVQRHFVGILGTFRTYLARITNQKNTDEATY